MHFLHCFEDEDEDDDSVSFLNDGEDNDTIEDDGEDDDTIDDDSEDAADLYSREENGFDDTLDDSIFDDVLLTNEDYVDESDDINLDFIPMTNSAETAITIQEEDVPKGIYVSGHVILNQCGSLLVRRNHNIASYKGQQHFLQKIASCLEGDSIPLLFPEAMMFPSIFWKMHSSSSSFLGALPSSLLAHAKSWKGFASLKDHIQTRLTIPFTSTSTNPTYVSFMFDSLSNLLMNMEDSRIIINRGLTFDGSDIGLKVKSRSDTCMHDSIDSKQVVKNLCASQKYHPMTFFLTFTCNQSMHFGIRHIKNWIDSNKWHIHFKGYDYLNFSEQEEIKNSMSQAAAPLLLRNWMEVRKILIDYLYDSPLSPYAPVQAIFARDEYQGDAGNLPHIHMMLSMHMDSLSEERKKNQKFSEGKYLQYSYS